MEHLIDLIDLSPEEIENLFTLAAKLKKELRAGITHHLLRGKTLGMIFSKSSTRTRVSFEVGMYQLGGYAIFLSSSDIQLGRGETIHDTAKVLSHYIDGIMIRTFKHSDVLDLAKYGTIPVINGLTDLMHPCQILSDLFTIYEKNGKLEGLKLAYVGDGNNVANSLLQGCAITGMDISVASPKGYECDAAIIEQARHAAKKSGSKVVLTEDPEEAVKDADVVYTDTWISMGQEAEKDLPSRCSCPTRSIRSCSRWQGRHVPALPARMQGYEVTEDIIDAPTRTSSKKRKTGST